MSRLQLNKLNYHQAFEPEGASSPPVPTHDTDRPKAYQLSAAQLVLRITTWTIFQCPQFPANVSDLRIVSMLHDTYWSEPSLSQILEIYSKIASIPKDAIYQYAKADYLRAFGRNAFAMLDTLSGLRMLDHLGMRIRPVPYCGNHGYIKCSDRRLSKLDGADIIVSLDTQLQSRGGVRWTLTYANIECWTCKHGYISKALVWSAKKVDGAELFVRRPCSDSLVGTCTLCEQ